MRPSATWRPGTYQLLPAAPPDERSTPTAFSEARMHCFALLILLGPVLLGWVIVHGMGIFISRAKDVDVAFSSADAFLEATDSLFGVPSHATQFSNLVLTFNISDHMIKPNDSAILQEMDTILGIDSHDNGGGSPAPSEPSEWDVEHSDSGNEEKPYTGPTLAPNDPGGDLDSASAAPDLSGKEFLLRPLPRPFSYYHCFTWQQDYEHCMVLTAAPIQVLPIDQFDIKGCDVFSTHPSLFLYLRVESLPFFVADDNKLKGTRKCTETLVAAILGADKGPSSPDFEQRCTFCLHHSWACSDSQLAMCQIAAQAKVASRLYSGQWSRDILNAFLFFVVSGATISYAMRPLMRLTTAPELRLWARFIETWRLLFAIGYWLIVMLVLMYCTSTQITAWTSDVFLIASISYYYYLICINGHVVAIVMLVLNALIGDGAQDSGILLTSAVPLTVGFGLTLLEAYVAYVWSGAH